MRVSLLFSTQEAKLKRSLTHLSVAAWKFTPLRWPPAQPIERGFIYGTRFRSVVSSSSYTSDPRHWFIKELQGTGTRY